MCLFRTKAWHRIELHACCEVYLVYIYIWCLLRQCIKIRGYTSTKLKTMISTLFSHFFRNIFLIIVLLNYEVSESAWCFCKNKTPPSHCPRKIGYTFNGPCPRGLTYIIPNCLIGRKSGQHFFANSNDYMICANRRALLSLLCYPCQATSTHI